MPNVMLALPNVGGALCSTPQNVGAALRCQDAKAVEISWAARPISAASRPKFILLLNKFFRCEDIA